MMNANRRRPRSMLGFLIVTALVVGAFGAASNDKKPPPTTTAERVATPAPAPAPAAAPDPVPSPGVAGEASLLYRAVHGTAPAKETVKETVKEKPKPRVDRSPAKQQGRWAAIQKFIEKGVFTKVGVPGSLPRVHVGPLFYMANFDDKQFFLGVVYAYYFDGSSDLDAPASFQNLDAGAEVAERHPMQVGADPAGVGLELGERFFLDGNDGDVVTEIAGALEDEKRKLAVARDDSDAHDLRAARGPVDRVCSQ